MAAVLTALQTGSAPALPLRSPASPQVRLHTDKDTGRPKGFAHVHFRWGTCWAGGVAQGWPMI